jgi:Meckel syndrome type 1 protein
MRESALFGTMFGLGAGAVLVGVTVSRLVVGQASDKAVEAPAAVIETASPAAVDTAPPAAVEPSPPVAVPSVAPPPAGMAMAGHHRPLPRKHRRPAVEEAAPKTAPVGKDIAPSASVANREAPPAAPPPAENAAPKAGPVAQDTAPPASIASREAPTAAPPPAEKPTPSTAPAAQDTAPTASIANREAPPAAPPPDEKAAPNTAPVVKDTAPTASIANVPVAHHAPIAVVRGGVVRPESRGPGARIIQVAPQGR